MAKRNGKTEVLRAYSNPDSSGFFVRPVSGILTQSLHGDNAVDIGAPIGTPVYAAGDGVVLIARSGSWNGGYGNYVVIKHPNGVQTVYGHLSQILVSQGEEVGRGNLIGKVGNTGRSTGPHLHFEMRGMANILRNVSVSSKVTR